MCGLVGIISRTASGLSHKDLDLMEWMLILDTIRGKDSTGVFAGFQNKQARVIKVATHPFNLFRAPDWEQFRRDSIARGRFVIGHNRAATRGTIKNDNAHPFVEDHIILSHNGTLWDHDNLTKEQVEVDSHAIAHALSKHSPNVVLPRIRGAFALVWFDTNTETLYAARNDERPLVILETDSHYILSSEPWIAGGPMSKQDRKINTIIDTVPGTLYQWDMKGKMSTSTFPLLHEKASKSDWENYWSALADLEDDNPFGMGETESPEIKDLRKAMAGVNNSPVKSNNEPSKTCALTQTSGSATGPTLTLTEESTAEAQLKGISIERNDFKKGEFVLVKIWNTMTTPGGRYKWTGKIKQPGKEMADCSGFLPIATKPGDVKQWIENSVRGQVMFNTYTTNGGLSVFIHNIEIEPSIPTHMGEIACCIWDSLVISKDPCSECNHPIEKWERVFTQVKEKSLFASTKTSNPINTVSTLCAHCITKRMPDGNFKENFKVRYNNAQKAAATSNSSVQDDKQKCQESSNHVKRYAAIQGSTTIQ